MALYYEIFLRAKDPNVIWKYTSWLLYRDQLAGVEVILHRTEDSLKLMK